MTIWMEYRDIEILNHACKDGAIGESLQLFRLFLPMFYSQSWIMINIYRGLPPLFQIVFQICLWLSLFHLSPLDHHISRLIFHVYHHEITINQH